MRKYRSNASSVIRIAYGIELVAGLLHFAQTKPTGLELQMVNKTLQAQYHQRIALQEPMLVARAALRFVEYGVDTVIRMAANAAQMADRGSRGRVFTMAFPRGLKPVVKPLGRAQVKPTRDLIERLTNCALGGVDAYRDEWLPRLKDALAGLEAAVAKYEAAKAAYDNAFQKELALRAAHFEAVDKVMGFVKFTFPRNREVQDLIFPVMGKGAKELEEEPALEEAGEEATAAQD